MDKTIDQRLTERADKLNKAHSDDHPDIRLMREAATIIQTLKDQIKDLDSTHWQLYGQPLTEWAEKQAWYDGELDHGAAMQRLIAEHADIMQRIARMLDWMSLLENLPGKEER